MGATIPRVAPFLASRYTGQETQIPSDLARPAGFEPATRCLEGSCSVRLSYGRSNVIVYGEDHATATRRSQCVGLEATPPRETFAASFPIVPNRRGYRKAPSRQSWPSPASCQPDHWPPQLASSASNSATL